MLIKKEFTLRPRARGFHLITDEIIRNLPRLPQAGILHLFIKHTSAGLSINENADPDVQTDMEAIFNHLVKEREPYYMHTCEGDDDMPAHAKSTLTGNSLSIPITDGRLNMGIWQGIYLCEFRNRGGGRKNSSNRHRTIEYMKMNNLPTNIFVATEKDYPELSELWEASVRSTHHFLSAEDIQYYKPLVQNVYFPAVQLYIIKNKDNRISGFLGLSDNLIEMLFIHPDEQGKGYGKTLLEFAVNERGFRKVDVNEQNEQAFRFYRNRGFEVISRDETDAQGKPFPILHMQLTNY